MQSVPRIPQGLGPPNVFPILLTQGDSSLDFTTVSGVSLDVQGPGGALYSWPASIFGTPTVSGMTVIYSFTGTENLPPGEYAFVVQMTVPGGAVPSNPFSAQVVPKFVC